MVPRIISPHAQFLCMGFYCAGRDAEMSAGAVKDKAPAQMEESRSETVSEPKRNVPGLFSQGMLRYRDRNRLPREAAMLFAVKLLWRKPLKPAEAARGGRSCL